MVIRGIILVVGKSLRQHAVSTWVTAASVGLGVGLLMGVFVLRTQSYNAMTDSAGGFDAVLGARGSSLQLVLNSVYHMEQSTGNLPWAAYKKIQAEPDVAYAIPYAVGDNYRGFRIVGTVSRLFTEHEYAEGRGFAFGAGGRVFDDARREAVIGSYVAQRTGLRVGSHFHSSHGVGHGEGDHTGHDHSDEFLVVGVLDTTNTPADRVVWVPLEAYYRMEGHALFGTGEKFVPSATEAIPDEHKEVSAVMLKLRGPAFTLENRINKFEKEASFVRVGPVLADLFEKVGWAHRALAMVAYLVVLVAAGGILASVYNAMNERRREFAILRALGARRATVFGAIVVESAAIAGLGAVIGWGIYLGLIILGGSVMRQRVGVVIDPWAWHEVLWLAPLGMVALGAMAGVVPAIRAYRTDVATSLTPLS